MGSMLSTTQLEDLSNEHENALVRNLARIVLNQRSAIVYKFKDRENLQKQVRDLTAENKKLRRNIAELKSQ